MALHDDLLEQADHLSTRERRRSRQASLRRAVSSAYYALFDLLVAEGARRLSPAQPSLLRQQIRRAFTHADMHRVCRQFAAGSPSQGAAQTIRGPLEAELKRVAEIFVELQVARHEADYDLAVSFNRVDALQKVELAREGFAVWKQIRDRPNATVFLAALLFQRQWRE